MGKLKDIKSEIDQLDITIYNYKLIIDNVLKPQQQAVTKTCEDYQRKFELVKKQHADMQKEVQEREKELKQMKVNFNMCSQYQSQISGVKQTLGKIEELEAHLDKENQVIEEINQLINQLDLDYEEARLILTDKRKEAVQVHSHFDL